MPTAGSRTGAARVPSPLLRMRLSCPFRSARSLSPGFRPAHPRLFVRPENIGFIRGALPQVEPVPPDDLPLSRLFRGTGQAYLNTSLFDAAKSVQVVFKSSPFGTQSHGYEANNSFLLRAYGKRLLIN